MPYLVYLLTHSYTHLLIILHLEPRMIGAYLGLTVSIVSIVWLIGYILLRFTEGAFVSYVSQNVGYTSRIIFKKVNKVKLELAMSLILLLYIPVLYTVTQALIYVQDWNDSHATQFTKNYNYYTPCYIRCSYIDLFFLHHTTYLLHPVVLFHLIMYRVFQWIHVQITRRIYLLTQLLNYIEIIK